MGRNQLVSVSCGRVVAVACDAGWVLVTAEGDAADHELRPGEQVVFRGRGKVVALGRAENSRVRISCR